MFTSINELERTMRMSGSTVAVSNNFTFGDYKVTKISEHMFDMQPIVRLRVV